MNSCKKKLNKTATETMYGYRLQSTTTTVTTVFSGMSALALTSKFLQDPRFHQNAHRRRNRACRMTSPPPFSFSSSAPPSYHPLLLLLLLLPISVALSAFYSPA